MWAQEYLDRLDCLDTAHIFTRSLYVPKSPREALSRGTSRRARYDEILDISKHVWGEHWAEAGDMLLSGQLPCHPAGTNY
jgi:hypothetical protein